MVLTDAAPRLRAGVDASYLRWQRSGQGRYLDGLLTALTPLITGDGGEVLAYYNSLPGPPVLPGATERFVRMPGSLAWYQAGLPLALRRDRPDVFLGGANLLPVLATTVPRVLVVLDCKPFRVPEAEPGRWGRYLRRWMPPSAQAATAVLALSRWTAAECERWLGVPAARTRVVYPGVDARFCPATSAAERDNDASARRRLGAPTRYVLQVGGFDRHKGGDVAEAAVQKLRTEQPNLVLVRCGEKGSTGSAPGRLDLAYVSDADLLALYRGAAAVCVTSRHEGFGLPVLEAMACGTPVVAARATALPEAGGEVALYAEPGDADSTVAALRLLLDDEEEWRRRSRAGIAWSARFSWDATATAVHDVLREVARPAAERMIRSRR
jgi:glycosyltransferase involved in cell wall biosynthesis